MFRRSHLWLFLIADTVASLVSNAEEYPRRLKATCLPRVSMQAECEDLRELTVASPLCGGTIDTRGHDWKALSLTQPGPEF